MNESLVCRSEAEGASAIIDLYNDSFYLRYSFRKTV